METILGFFTLGGLMALGHWTAEAKRELYLSDVRADPIRLQGHLIRNALTLAEEKGIKAPYFKAMSNDEIKTWILRIKNLPDKS